MLYFHNRSDEIFIQQEDRTIFNLEQEKIRNEAITFVKKTCQSNIATVFKLGKLFYSVLSLTPCHCRIPTSRSVTTQSCRVLTYCKHCCSKHCCVRDFSRGSQKQISERFYLKTTRYYTIIEGTNTNERQFIHHSQPFL